MVYHQHGRGGWGEVLLEALGHDAQLPEVLLPQRQVAVREVTQAAIVTDSAVPRRALTLPLWSSLLFLQQSCIVSQCVSETQQLSLEALQFLQCLLRAGNAARCLMVCPANKKSLGSVCPSPEMPSFS